MRQEVLGLAQRRRPVVDHARDRSRTWRACRPAAAPRRRCRRRSARASGPAPALTGRAPRLPASLPPRPRQAAQTNGELRAVALARRSWRTPSRRASDEAADDRQPEPEPALRSLQRLPLLHEEIEDPRQHLGRRCRCPCRARSARRPRPRRARSRRWSRRARCTSRRWSAGWRPPARAAPASPCTVRPVRGTSTRRLVALLLEQRARHLDGARDHVGDLDRCPPQLDLAARDARDVEQIVDQADQVLDLALDDAALALGGVHAPQFQQLQRGEDRRERDCAARARASRGTRPWRGWRLPPLRAAR